MKDPPARLWRDAHESHGNDGCSAYTSAGCCHRFQKRFGSANYLPVVSVWFQSLLVMPLPSNSLQPQPDLGFKPRLTMKGHKLAVSSVKYRPFFPANSRVIPSIPAPHFQMTLRFQILAVFAIFAVNVL